MNAEQLRAVLPGQYSQAATDLVRASDEQQRAAGEYAAQVKAPVQSGSIWSDPSTPNAVAVLEVLRLSFDTAAANLSAAANATNTLAVELGLAQRQLHALDQEAEAKGLAITVHGVQAVEEGDSSGGYMGSVDTRGIQAMQTMLDAVLERAGAADSACAAILDRVAEVSLPLTASNAAGVLDRARHANDAAYATLGHAVALAPQLRKQTQQLYNEIKNDKPWIVDVLKGLWDGYAQAVNGFAELMKLSVQSTWDENAEQKLDQIYQRLLDYGVGDWLNLDLLKQGKVGEFIGKNLWLAIPLPGKAVAQGGAGAAMEVGRAVTVAESKIGQNPGQPVAVPPEVARSSHIAAGYETDANGRPASLTVIENVGADSKQFYPPLAGNDQERAAAAQRTVEEIVTTGRAMPVEGGGTRYVAPDGRSVTFDANGDLVAAGDQAGLSPSTDPQGQEQGFPVLPPQ